MATTPRQSFVQRVLGAKKGAEQRLQGIGQRISKNIAQGQADLESGKSSYYGAINPLK